MLKKKSQNLEYMGKNRHCLSLSLPCACPARAKMLHRHPEMLWWQHR